MVLEDLTICARLFYFSHRGEFILKKNALICLANMAKVAMDG